MSPDERKELAKDIAKGISGAEREKSPINPQNIFFGIGVLAVGFLVNDFNATVEANTNGQTELTEVVNRLVLVSENQQEELGRRANWMSNADTYSEESRAKDEEHDQNYRELNRRLLILEANE